MFWICCAPEMFQDTLEMVFASCAGCMNYLDDIMIHGRTKTEHDERLAAVLKRLGDDDILLNEKKFHYEVTSVGILGYRFSSRCIEVATDKAEAIKLFWEPETAEEVRSTLGLYFILSPICPLCHTRYVNSRNRAFHSNGCPRLRRRSRNWNVSWSSQRYCAIMILCRGLTDVEKPYAQTEKVALALEWAVERLRHFFNCRHSSSWLTISLWRRFLDRDLVLARRLNVGYWAYNHSGTRSSMSRENRI